MIKVLETGENFTPKLIQSLSQSYVSKSEQSSLLRCRLELKAHTMPLETFRGITTGERRNDSERVGLENELYQCK
jgi:hypothetical protein